MASEGQYFGGNVALLGKLGVGTLTPTEKIEVDGNVSLTDNSKLLLGGGDDLQLYHNGSHSWIEDTGQGDLYIKGSDDVYIMAGSDIAINCNDNAEVSLWYNNSKKFETTNTGATVTGKLIVNGDFDVSGTTTTFNSTVVTVDDPVFTLGGDTAPGSDDSKDRGIEFRYHDGSSARVGFFGYDDSEDAFTFLTDATNNSEVFSGTLGSIKVGGGTVTGTLYVGNSIDHWGDGGTGLSFPSNDVVAFKTSGTEAARFDSSGDLTIKGGRIILRESDDGNDALKITRDADEGYVQLFSSGSQTVELRGNGDSYFNGGNFVIGATTAQSKFHVSGGDIRLDNAKSLLGETNGGGNFQMVKIDTSDNMRIGDGNFVIDITGSSELMRLNSAGLGIGVSSPAAKLDIVDSQTQSGSAGTATILSTATTTATSTQSSGMYAIQNYFNLTGTSGSFQNAAHQQVQTTVSSTGTATNLKNHLSRVHTSGSGQINTVAHYNIHGEFDGNGTISKWMGYAVADGTLSSFTNTGHTITNTYGLYIGDLTSGTQTNTPYGVYQSGTDMINYFGGSVGIGVNNPQDFNSEANNLVIGTGSGAEGMTIYGGSDAGSYIYFADGTSGSALYEGFIQYRHGDRAFRFGVATGVRMTLDANGFLGINTTSPSKYLTVEGTARITGHTDIANSIDISGKTRIYDKLGVGGGAWVDPTKSIDVRGEGRVWNGANGCELSYSTGNTSAIYASANTSGNIEFRTDIGATAKMFITNAGLCGIGTNSPSAFLHISKDNNNSGNQFCVADTEGVSAAVRTYTHDGDAQGLILNHYYAVAGSGNEYMRYADFVSNVGNGAGTSMRFITKNAANTYSTVSIDNSGNLDLGDNQQVRLGASDDLQLYHDGTHSYISNTQNSGNLIIENGGNDHDIVFRCDDGSGGVETYFFLDGSASSGAPRTIFPDYSTLNFGASMDLRILHDGSHSYIIGTNNSCDMYIRQDGADRDIIFQCDDGSGGEETYFYLDGSAGNIPFEKALKLLDSVQLNIGTGNDLQLYHDGSNSYVTNATGDLYFINSADDKDIVFMSDDGSGGFTTYFSLDGSGAPHPRTTFPDNSTLQFGTGGDLQILNDGTDSYIRENTRHLYIQNTANDSDIIFQSDDGSGGVATYFRLDGGFTAPVTIFPDNSSLSFGTGTDFSLYHDGSNSYINQTGTGNLIIRTNTDDGDIIFQSDNGSGGVETYFFLDGSLSGGDPFTVFPDDSYLAFGPDADMTLHHDGTDSKIRNQTGNLVFEQNDNDKDIVFKCDDGSGGVTEYFYLDGSAGNILFGKELRLIDGVQIQLGTDNDMQITHNGATGTIQNATGDLAIKAIGTDADLEFHADDGSGGQTKYFHLDGGTTKIVLTRPIDANYTIISNVSSPSSDNDAVNLSHLNSSLLTTKNDQTNTTYTLVAGDARKQVRLNNASTVTVTVPKSVFSAGDVITLFRKGAGGVTISPVDSDVTINSVGTKRKLAYQYSAATLICVTGGGTPEFDLIGDLTT